MIKWSEHIGWLEKNVPGHSRKEIAAAWNKEHPDMPVTETIISSAYKRLGFKTGHTGYFPKGTQSGTPIKKGEHRSEETQFKKGQQPHNHKPVGSITSRKNHHRGNYYYYIKVAEPNKWELLHRWMWEQVHGEIPKGYNIIFKNNNPEDCTIDNLAIVSKQQHIEIQRLNLSRSTENFDTIKLMADLQIKNFDKKRTTKNHTRRSNHD